MLRTPKKCRLDSYSMLSYIYDKRIVNGNQASKAQNRINWNKQAGEEFRPKNLIHTYWLVKNFLGQKTNFKNLKIIDQRKAGLYF